MASFELSLPLSLAWEGKKHECVPGDPGGETVWGISRRAWPNWPGWAIIDAMKPATDAELTARINASPQLVALITMVYRTAYWSTACKLNDQANAAQLMDMCVNMGCGRAVTYLQRSLCLMGWTLSIDADLGPHTQGAANAVNQDDLFKRMFGFRCMHYLMLAEADPTKAEFLSGWLNRTFSFRR